MHAILQELVDLILGDQVERNFVPDLQAGDLGELA